MADLLNITIFVKNNTTFKKVICHYVCAPNEVWAFKNPDQGNFEINSSSHQLKKVERRFNNLYFWCQMLNKKYFFKQDISGFNTTSENSIEFELK